MRIAELTILEDDVTPDRVQELVNRGARIYMPRASLIDPGCIDKEYWLEYSPESDVSPEFDYSDESVWFYDGEDECTGWECMMDSIGLLIMEEGPSR